MYNTYIRPKLESNTPVWSPFLLKDINKIESVQKRFTKIVFQKCGIPFTSYEDRLRKINFLSLKQRRNFFDLVLMYKLINNISDLKFEDYFVTINSNYGFRSHSLQIKSKSNFNSSQWFNSFFGRIPSRWNSLPSKIVTSPTLVIFKSCLRSHLLKTKEV